MAGSITRESPINELDNNQSSSAKLGLERYIRSKYILHETLGEWFGPYVFRLLELSSITGFWSLDLVALNYR